mmetsp:Transcript_24787/g.36686  ORF Transcript_24787/g.36686 Transcript_24787/m.36686 type:complete len:349 (-) Transcript_24787:214-1260(-)
MKAQHLLLALPVAQSFTTTVHHTSFVSRNVEQVIRGRSSTAVWDTEADIDVVTRDKIASLLQQASAPALTVEESEEIYGMPWKSSIDSSLEEDAMLYMPFWEWQMQFMKENLTNLRTISTCSEDSENPVDFSYKENSKKGARIVSTCYASDEYRKIRMTYYDAGDNTQVFNSVWYPNPKYNLPVLGIDLLSFNQKKYLAIVDFQPIHENEEDHALPFEEHLKPIKEKYDSLKGRMSSKFYDETQFFSQEMLFARFEDESIVNKDLFPAFQEYVQTHLKLVRETEPVSEEMPFILERQKAYDTYSAQRDPATGLFAAMFGEEWADGFVYDFLFALSSKKEESKQEVAAR